ncbi:MAG: response regulator [Lachnospiraceae bacterium]|nr:response regulator [Lachnospiraceae bacterium]
MKAICVDDEELVLFRTVSLVKKTKKFDQIEHFTDAQEALAWFDEGRADLAFLDIDMPGMKGLDLATAMKEKCPGIKVIFLTSYSEYAVDAFTMHASGYLLKPVGYDRLLAEIEFALGSEETGAGGGSTRGTAGVRVETFGFFNVLVDGRPVSFKRSKAKELLACLVDRQGQFVSRKDLFYILWEDDNYDRAKQKYFDTIIRSLKETLDEYEIADIFELEKGMMRVVPEEFDCDLYRYLSGDKAAVAGFRGEYMSSYSWAAATEGYLTER